MALLDAHWALGVGSIERLSIYRRENRSSERLHNMTRDTLQWQGWEAQPSILRCHPSYPNQDTSLFKVGVPTNSM